MVREGYQVEVVDVETKEDVTSYILLQIVLEEAKKKSSLLPLSLLYLINNLLLNKYFWRCRSTGIINPDKFFGDFL